MTEGHNRAKSNGIGHFNERVESLPTRPGLLPTFLRTHPMLTVRFNSIERKTNIKLIPWNKKKMDDFNLKIIIRGCFYKVV